jgi:putative glutamine amidotransferase
MYPGSAKGKYKLMTHIRAFLLFCLLLKFTHIADETNMKAKKIKIGLTYTGSEAKHNNYVKWIKEDDDTIEVLKLSAEENNLEKVPELDALVMSGGIDTHPKHYGSTITDYPNAPEKFNEARDEFEIAVFNLALQQNLPTLAICRGMQLVNCILGGDLKQDLGEEKNELHRNVDDPQKHEVIIQPGTLLHTVTEKETDVADSAHHQCINHLGRGLMENAKSHDGIIEGIEWADKKDKPFFLAVQWHPERMHLLDIQSSALSKNIREYFLKTVREGKQ